MYSPDVPGGSAAVVTISTNYTDKIIKLYVITSLFEGTGVKPHLHCCVCVSICMTLVFAYGVKSILFKFSVSSSVHTFV